MADEDPIIGSPIRTLKAKRATYIKARPGASEALSAAEKRPVAVHEVFSKVQIGRVQNNHIFVSGTDKAGKPIRGYAYLGHFYGTGFDATDVMAHLVGAADYTGTNGLGTWEAEGVFDKIPGAGLLPIHAQRIQRNGGAFMNASELQGGWDIFGRFSKNKKWAGQLEGMGAGMKVIVAAFASSSASEIGLQDLDTIGNAGGGVAAMVELSVQLGIQNLLKTRLLPVLRANQNCPPRCAVSSVATTTKSRDSSTTFPISHSAEPWR